ncbi:conserved exported hypothetical protein [Desulfosarcina cetonica]|nr:conserved exported hypothetical protein [Desulfosarcina cetonica]
MRMFALTLVCLFCLTVSANAQGGMASIRSNHSVIETADRLASALKEKGWVVYDRIDHAAAARQVGQTLRPTLLILFGSPTMNTPLIQRSRTMGIDLPLKALIWEDANRIVWLTYTPPDDLARRHGITEMGDTLREIQTLLSNVATAVTLP